jgi:hypothetical protein
MAVQVIYPVWPSISREYMEATVFGPSANYRNSPATSVLGNHDNSG